jgi:hypothetical protein
MPNPKGNPQTLRKYKPKWQSGGTQTIRVPVALTERILDYAHSLDEGKTEQNHPANLPNETLTQVINWLREVADTPRNNFSKQKKQLVLNSISELETLLQVNH